MAVTLTFEERAALEDAAGAERRVKVWRRYRAILLANEHGARAAAQMLGCSRPSVYVWLDAFRREGIAALRPRQRVGRPRLAGAGARLLGDLLERDPQGRGWHATGWTVPLLRTELEQAGLAVGERTVRRTLHRLGYAWKRPKYRLGRPDPAYAEKNRRSWSAPRRS